MDKQKRKNYGNNKSYYNKRSRQYCLDVGMTGFLCTCNFREKECIRDAYKILEEFATELYGSDDKNLKDPSVKVAKKDGEESAEKKDTSEEKEDEKNEDDDISDALNKEIAELKADAKKPAAARRFQNADAGVKNMTFISTTLPDPLELALTIFKKLEETKQQRTRFLLRLVPIQVVCKANMSDIKIKADQLFEKYFAQEPKTFSIIFNRHCNDKIRRTEIIEELADLISKKNPGNRADLSNPEIAVVVEIVRSFCLLAIAPDYFKYKKYNLLELCNVKEVEKDTKEPEVSPEKDAEKIDTNDVKEGKILPKNDDGEKVETKNVNEATKILTEKDDGEKIEAKKETTEKTDSETPKAPEPEVTPTKVEDA